MGSIIVVSDTHWGHENSSNQEFERLLHFLNQPRAVAHLHDRKKEIKKVEKIILLGDIFEMWDPEGDDRKNILVDSLISLRKLSELGPRIVYIVGNHDEEMDIFNGKYDGRKIKIKRFYKLPKRGGPYSYSFVHGHQFDKTFIRVGTLWKLPGIVTALNNLWKRIPSLRKLLIYSFFLAIPFMFLNAFFSIIAPLYLYLLEIISSTAAIPAIWTRYQKPFHTLCSKFSNKFTRTSSKYKGIAEIINQRFYKEEIGPDTDVIVFGHTHVPGHLILVNELTLKKVFLNTGSWMNDEEESCTLVYIDTDENEHYLLKWDKKGRLEEIYPPTYGTLQNKSLTILERFHLKRR